MTSAAPQKELSPQRNYRPQGYDNPLGPQTGYVLSRLLQGIVAKKLSHHQSCHVTHVYAFGQLEDSHKTLKGGTGWTVQLALDANKTVYVFDTLSETWFQPFYYVWTKTESLSWETNFQFQPLGNTAWNQWNQSPPIYQPNQVLCPCFIKPVLWWDLALFLTEPEKKSELCSEEHSTWKKKCKV